MKKGDLIIIGFWVSIILISWKAGGDFAFGLGLLFGLLLTLWALIDIARVKRDFGYKLIWILISIFLGGFGATLYYFLEVRKRGENKERNL